jgi:hypothetical protein
MLFVGSSMMTKRSPTPIATNAMPTDAPRSWLTSHAWLILAIAGAGLGVFAISRMVRR